MQLVEALDALADSGNPLEQGHCHSALARCYDPGSEKARQHEKLARELYREAGRVPEP